MTKVPVKNTTHMPIYVGSSMVPPGEIRHFPEHQVPDHLRPRAEKVVADEAPTAITAILDKNIPEITPLLEGLTDDELAEIKAAEENGKTRTGLMKAIGEEELKRADAKVPNPGAETDTTTGEVGGAEEAESTDS